MTEEQVRNIVKEILAGYDTVHSPWFVKEFGENNETISQITDGTRPKGYATREELAAMIARAMLNK